MDTKENEIRFFSVADRFTLRYRFAQHATRSLAEKQALIKFYDLKYDITDRLDNEQICQPLIVGPCLQSKGVTTSSVSFTYLSAKQKRLLLPYLTNFIEIVGKQDSFSRFTGRACNLRKLPEQKILSDESTVNLFSFHTYHCQFYLPVQVLQMKSVTAEPRLLEKIQQWFYSVRFNDEGSRAAMQADLQKAAPFPLLLFVLNLALAAAKITPHVALPYHLYTCISSKSLNAELFLTAEFPELSLGKYAYLDANIATNEIQYKRWMSNERKNLGQILTPIFAITYTLYIYALLGIYEKPFANDEQGLEWVDTNIRAHKMHSNGYWTYTLPSHRGTQGEKSFPHLMKHVPNYGVFWLMCDFSIFQSPSERAQSKSNPETSVNGHGILFYVIQSLMDQVSSWDRKSRRTSIIRASPELEVGELSLHQDILPEDILHRLEHLKTQLSRPVVLSSPLEYRAILEEVIFYSWNVRPGMLSISKTKLKQQVAFTLQDFERNCLLQSEIRNRSLSVPYLENLELEVFGWTIANPLLLPPFTNEIFVSRYPQEYFIKKDARFYDESMEHLIVDAHHKAVALYETEKFWDVIRRIRHLYLWDSYEILRENKGLETWNPPIPRQEEVQQPEDCVRYGYSILSQHEGQDWYSFLEQELISRFFRIDVKSVSLEAKELAEKIGKAANRYGEGFLQALKQKVGELPKEEGRLFPDDVMQIDLLVQSLTRDFAEEEKKHTKETLPKEFVDIGSRYSLNPTKIPQVLGTVRKQVYIEDLETIFPDMMALISLLPDFYRNRILAPDEETTVQDNKRDLQTRVLKLQQHLQDAELDELVADYPVPPGREPLRTSAQKAEEKKAQRQKRKPEIEPLLSIDIVPKTEAVKRGELEEFSWVPQKETPKPKPEQIESKKKILPELPPLAMVNVPPKKISESTVRQKTPVPKKILLPNLLPISISDVPLRH